MMHHKKSQTHFRACCLCEAMCGLEIAVEDGEIRSIRGDRADPFSRGHICPKAVALQDIQNDPDRLKHPLRRTPTGGWQRCSWKAAFDEAGERLLAVQQKYGRDSVGVYLGNPVAHNYGALLYGPPLYRTLRTKNKFSATSVDQLPHHLAASLMFGHQMLLPIPDLDRTQFLFMLGANPTVSNGSLMTAPGIRRRLEELGRRGGRLVVVDPRRSETASNADQHLFIRPGTDALLLVALLRILFEEGLDRPGRVGEFTDGLATVRQLVADVPLERIAAVTGIADDDVRALARDFASASSAVCYGRLGVSTQRFGGLCQWLINLLNIVTGNLDRPGGVMFCRPAVDLVARTGRGGFGRWTSRVRALPSFGGELPSATMAEEMLTDGPGQIRALLTVAGNPVLSTPNGCRLERALGGLDFMVSIDPYLNETTRHAHLILPPTGPLERDHYDLAFHALAVRNTTRYSPPLFEPEPDSRHDWQILDTLRRRLDKGPVPRRVVRWIASKLGPRRMLSLGLRSGPYGSGLNLFGRGLTLSKVADAAHGIDLGPLQSCLPDRLVTPDKRIHLAPEEFVNDLQRALKLLDDAPQSVAGEGTLLLIGRRQLRSNNSWMHNYSRLMGGRERCTLLMHSKDAQRIRVLSGQQVNVTSRVGRIEVPVEITDDIMPGVVSLPHGWGHHRKGTRLTTAQQHPGASINDLTDDQQVDDLAGTAAFNPVPVSVEPQPE
jgi:anaerobic selenocysteine-containing dehydrogenase